MINCIRIIENTNIQYDNLIIVFITKVYQTLIYKIIYAIHCYNLLPIPITNL